jgi:hypothetical protein
MLDAYRVCYLSGPNLTVAAAAKLKQWVKNGGTLWLSAGAASRDEFNRPLHVLDDILPAARSEALPLQSFLASGRYLNTLVIKDEVHWDGGKTSVLAIKQPLQANAGTSTLARFKDGNAAMGTAAQAMAKSSAAPFCPP